MNRDLFLAILAMGSYNRGYDPGIKGLSDSVDTHLGNAVIKQAMGDEITMAAGFYALAYKWGDQTVISNRGTDSFDLSNRANDVLNGWLAGIGKKRRKSTWRWRSRLSPPPA